MGLVYLPTWMVNYLHLPYKLTIHVGKYTTFPWILWEIYMFQRPFVGEKVEAWSALNMASLTWAFAKLSLRHPKLYAAIASHLHNLGRIFF